MTTARGVLVVALALALLGFARTAAAQPPERTVRIGLWHRRPAATTSRAF